MAVEREMWQNVIVEELFASNDFLNHMKNADEYVIGGKFVHKPQSGGATGAEKNRATLPAAVVTRTDTILSYPLDVYTSNPVLISNAEQVELSYDKMQSVIRENNSELIELVAEDTLYKGWENIPLTGIIDATGADAAASASGATGTRKIITEADIRRAQVLLNKQNVPKMDRFMLLDSESLNHLSDDKDLKYAFQQTIDIANGAVAKLAGFYLLERSTTLSIDAAGAIKDPTAAAATTDSTTGLFWQKNAIERALGDVKMFDENGSPIYYGDLYSMLIRAGGRNCRADNKGYGLIRRVA